jgi:aminopeptidase YwaD
MKNHTFSLQNHMKMLCETIGTRPTGSMNNRMAVDYSFDVFQKCGLQTRKQEFDCIDWVNSGAVLLVDNNDVTVESAEYSLPCDVEAEFVCIDTVTSLKNATLLGKVAILHGELCNEPLMPKNFKFYNPDEHKQIIALLEEKNPVAIITVNQHKEHIIQDGDFSIPCAVVCVDTLSVFLQSTRHKIKLTINTQRIPTKSHNVIATYGTSRNKVCFSAHLDTKPTTPGALDNASGVSVLLAFAESLMGNNYPFQIEIVLLNGEDYYSTPGEITYMELITPEYNWAVNIDGIGLMGSKTSVSFYECPNHFEERFMERVKKTTDIERIEPWPMGDHMIFVNHGIPAIAITASNIFDLIENVIHTPDDDLKLVDINILNNIVCFLLDCIGEIK